MSLAHVSVLHDPAWLARLELTLARRGHRTVIERRRHEGPLMVQRPFYPEDDGCCHVYILHPPGGVAGGDELDLSVSVSASASTLLTTPAASKIYRTKGPSSSLRQTFTVSGGASVEWLPQETIVFGGASARSTTSVRLEADARYVGWEITCLGRPASGDDFETGSFRQSTEIWRDGKLVFVDRTLVGAKSPARRGPWGFGGRTVYATLFATGGSDALVARVRARVTPERPGDLFAVTLLPGVTVCRWLGSSAEQAKKALGSAWNLIRTELLGKPSVPPRIWTS